MQASIKIREDIKKVSKNLSLDGAEGLLNDASRWLEGVSGQAEGRLDIAISALSRAISELSTSQQGVESCLSSLDFDPLELEQTEERLFSIRALARKHSVLPDDLALFKQELSRKLKGIELGADKIISLEQQLFQFLLKLIFPSGPRKTVFPERSCLMVQSSSRGISIIGGQVESKVDFIVVEITMRMVVIQQRVHRRIVYKKTLWSFAKRRAK